MQTSEDPQKFGLFLAALMVGEDYSLGGMPGGPSVLRLKLG